MHMSGCPPGGSPHQLVAPGATLWRVCWSGRAPQPSTLIGALVCQGAQDAALGGIEAHASDQHAPAALQDLGPAEHDGRAVRMLQHILALARKVALVHPAPTSTDPSNAARATCASSAPSRHLSRCCSCAMRHGHALCLLRSIGLILQCLRARHEHTPGTATSISFARMKSCWYGHAASCAPRICDGLVLACAEHLA